MGFVAMALWKYNTLACTLQPPVLTITLDRPRSSNRVSAAMAAELRQVCQRLVEEDGVRVCVLTGRGRTFSAGRESLGLGSRATRGYQPRELPRELLDQHRAASALGGVQVPLVAAINGDATDHGLELALACDLRIASPGARLGFTDLSRGVVPWDGGTQRLPRLVGRGLALEMLLTGRLLEVQEAQDAGLVNAVAAPGGLQELVDKTARDIAAGAPIAARYAKEAVLKGMDMALDQGLRLEADLNVILQSTRDRAEGIQSFLDKKEPRFQGE